VRIIAGRYKGRRLKTPDWEGVRPTSDKLRETLFNVLAPRIQGARVVDGYAGTGAVGIEALSRGAAQVIFIEKNRRTAALIEQNLKVCGIEEGYTIHCADIAAALDGLPASETFDLILLDPPYDTENLNVALGSAARRVVPGGLVVLEHATRREADAPPPLCHVRDVRAGDSTLTIFSVKL